MKKKSLNNTCTVKYTLKVKFPCEFLRSFRSIEYFQRFKASEMRNILFNTVFLYCEQLSQMIVLSNT